MTSTAASPDVHELRSLFRYLQEFRSLYELEGIEEVTTPQGRTWSIWDLEYLYAAAEHLLTTSQYRAIMLFLVEDHKEADAAELMGVSRTNPVGMYASLGLSKLIEFIEHGGLDRFRSRRDGWQDDHLRMALSSAERLAGKLREQTELVLDGCLRFLPTPAGRVPRIRLRTSTTASGFLYVNPMLVMYVAHIGLVPTGFTLHHRPALPHHLACVNHEHADLARQPSGRSK